jgi:hypothetical protein
METEKKQPECKPRVGIPSSGPKPEVQPEV